MKTMFKRNLAIILALVMMFTLAACDVPEYVNKPTDVPAITSPIDDVETSPTTTPDTPIIADETEGATKVPDVHTQSFNYDDVPEYNGEAFWTVNNGVPYFTDEEMHNTKTFENYSNLDSLGRCDVAYANLDKTLMPDEDRKSLGGVTPSGWNNKQYNSDLVDGGWIYNRAHLIGFQLAGEQDNPLNLITGTRYMNVNGMLPFENMIADYIKETNNHVLYRVTPIFIGNELVCRGVLMEAYSVEDEGDGICYNVFCYNVQPGITIDYMTGDNYLENTRPNNSEIKDNKTEENQGDMRDYVLNTSSKKFHNPDCSSVAKMSEKNKEEITTTREFLIDEGYEPCGGCNP